MGHLIPARRPDRVIINNNKKKKRRIFRIVDFTVPVNHRVKIKEIEKINKYLDFVGGLKTWWNKRVTVISVEVGSLGTVPKGLERRLEESVIRRRIETIKTTTML